MSIGLIEASRKSDELNLRHCELSSRLVSWPGTAGAGLIAVV